jgi:hypothetical protein
VLPESSRHFLESLQFVNVVRLNLKELSHFLLIGSVWR